MELAPIHNSGGSNFEVGPTVMENVCPLLYIIHYVQCVPLATEPGISLIILTPTKMLQRNLNRNTFVVWETKRNVFVVCVCSRFKFRCNILISGKIIKEMPGSVASVAHCIITQSKKHTFSYTNHQTKTDRLKPAFPVPSRIKNAGCSCTWLHPLLIPFISPCRVHLSPTSLSFRKTR